MLSFDVVSSDDCFGRPRLLLSSIAAMNGVMRDRCVLILFMYNRICLLHDSVYNT